MNQNNDEVEIDLREILYLFQRKILIILLAIMISGVGVGMFSYYFVKPIYSSTSKIFILTKSTSITTLADIQMGASLTQDYIELVKSRPVVEKVIDNLSLDTTYEELLEILTIGNPADTRILSFTVQDREPRLAKEIADEFAAVSIASISTIMETDEPNIVETGHIAIVPDSPNVKKNAAIGGILGGLLAIGIILLIYFLDDTIKSSDDIEKYLQLTTLGAIPISEEEYDGHKSKKRKNKKKKKKKEVK